MGKARARVKKNKNTWKTTWRFIKLHPWTIAALAVVVLFIWSYSSPTAPWHNLWRINPSEAAGNLTSGEIVPPEVYILPLKTFTFGWNAYDENHNLMAGTPIGPIAHYWEMANPAAGSINGASGVFVASNQFGDFPKAIKLTIWNIYYPLAPKLEIFADVHITNDLSPILDAPTPLNSSWFVFQDIVLKWHRKPGTVPTGYIINYRYNGKSMPPANVGPSTSLTLKETDIEKMKDGKWEWGVTAIIGGINYPPLIYGVINKKTGTNFTYPNSAQCQNGSITIYKPQQVFTWEALTGAKQYALRIGLGNAAGPYWYAASLVYMNSINIIDSLYQAIPNHIYLYVSVAGTVIPGGQTNNNTQYQPLSYGTVCKFYVNKS